MGRFSFNVAGLVAADLGCHRGGFTDCLLQRGAARVHSVDTGYGILDWKLRNDPRVIVHERTNLLHWVPPDPVDVVVIDGGWTPQRLSVPAAMKCLKAEGAIISLVKPQYEAPRELVPQGVLPREHLEDVMRAVRESLPANARIVDEAESPILGSGGNIEKWFLIRSKS